MSNPNTSQSMINNCVDLFVNDYLSALLNGFPVRNLSDESIQKCKQAEVDFKSLVSSDDANMDFFISQRVSLNITDWVRKLRLNENVKVLIKFDEESIHQYQELIVKHAKLLEPIISKVFYNTANKLKEIQMLYSLMEINQSDYSMLNENIENLSKEYKHTRSGFETLNNSFKDTQGKVYDTQVALKKTIKKFSEYDHKATEHSVSVLGIFAAIVLVLNTFLSFSDSTLEHFISGNPYRAILTLLVFSFVIANVLILLLAVLYRIKSDKKIQARIKSKLQTENDMSNINNRKNQTSIPELIVYFVNIVFIVLLFVFAVMWRTGFIEQRNAGIGDSFYSISEKGDAQHIDATIQIENIASEETTSKVIQ